MINRKIIFAISLLFYSVSYSAYVTYKDSIPNSFCSKVETSGYVEFKNEDFGIDFYSELYKSYDEFLALIKSKMRLEIC